MDATVVKLEKNSLPQAILRELNKIHNDEEDADVSSKEEYISPDHKKFCKTGDLNYLSQPIISHSTWSVIPFKSLLFKNIYALDNKPNYSTKVDITNPLHHSFIEFNNYNGRFLVNKSIFNTIMYDTEWLKEQLSFVYNLNTYDTFTLKGYTFNGDVFANNLLRGTLDQKKFRYCNDAFKEQIIDYFPLFMQLDKLFNSTNHDVFKSDQEKTKVQRISKIACSFPQQSATLADWKRLLSNRNLKMSERYAILVPLWSHLTEAFQLQVLELFIKDLINIIMKAPKNTKQMVVYRGVRNNFYLQESKDNIYKNIGFVSTSLDIDVAKEFQKPLTPNDDAKCCIQRILVPKGTHSVVIFPISTFQNEKEVLLPSGVIYKLFRKKILKSFYRHPENASTDLCFNNIIKVGVSDIVLTNPQDNIF